MSNFLKNIFSYFKNISKNSSIYSYFDQIIVSGSNFLLGLILARVLGLEDFGTFTLCWSFVLLTTGMQNSLITFPLLTLGGKYNSTKNNNFFLSSLYMQIIFSVLWLLLLISAGHVLSIILNTTSYNYLIIPLAFAMFTTHIQEYLRKLAFTKFNFIKALLNDLLCHGLKMILILYFALTNQLDIKVTIFIIGFTCLLSALIFFPYNIILYKVNFQSFRFHFFENWKFSSWLLPASIFQWVTGNIFILVGGYFVSVTAVGAVKSVQNIMGIMHIFFQAQENYLPPKASAILNEKSSQEARRYVYEIGIRGFIYTTIFSLFVMIFHEPIFTTIYGASFSEYSRLLLLYAPMYPLVYLSLVFRIWIRTIEATKLIMESYFIMAIYSCLISYPFTLYFGVYGMVFGIFTTHLVMVITLFIKNKKYQEHFIKQSSK